MMKSNGNSILYQTVAAYMSAFKYSMIDRYHLIGIPN